MPIYCPIHPDQRLVPVIVSSGDGNHLLKNMCIVCNNLTKVKYKCPYCGKVNEYWDIKGNEKWCRYCHNSGRVIKKGSPRTKKIPSWRLMIDDRPSDEVLKGSPDDYGMPSMTSQEWKEYYSQDFEVEKQKQFESQRKKEQKEILKSLPSHEQLDTN